MVNSSLSGCVILKEGQILLLNRRKTGWYELPGGKMDKSESPEETAIRELKEELLCDVEIIRKLGTKEFLHNNEPRNYHWFLAKIEENQEPKLGEPEKFEHYKYIKLKDLYGHNLSPNMQNLLSEIKNNNINLS